MANRFPSSVLEFIRKIAEPKETAALSDTKLLERFVSQKDANAFAALIRRHGSMVLGVCKRLLPNSHDAEDAFQATFLVLVRRAHSLSEPALLGSWLYGAAYRTAAKARVASAKRRAKERPLTTTPVASADHQVVGSELRPLLDEELSRLPEKYRLPVVLCYLEGKTTTEVARQLGCPRGTVGTRLKWARRRLHNRLTRRGVTIGSAGLSGALTASRVSTRLLDSTVRAAVCFSAGEATTAGAVSAEVARLTRGVLQSMVITKLKFAGAVSLTFFVAGIAGWLSYVSLAAGQPIAPTAERSELVPSTRALLANEAEDTWPKGWGGGSNQQGEYEVRVDRSVAHGGQASGSVKSLVADPKGFGSLTQAFKADEYHGKRIRFSGYIKVKDVSSGAGLWMRIDSENKTVGFDNMDKRSLKETGDWKKCEIVLDVPADSARITFGMLMKGSGQAWVDDLKFMAVGNDVASTNLLEKEIPIPGLQGTVPDKPANLDFEEKD